MTNSSGNILFVILIAVALFAALSYAVTQSSRGTGSNTVKETATINSSVLSQYTASLRASLQRLTTDNQPLLELEFNAPADFEDLSDIRKGVFHPEGGGVIFIEAPAELVDNAINPDHHWIFTMNFEVDGIGMNASGSIDGNDLLAILPGVRQEVCRQANQRLGITATPLPTVTGTNYATDLLSNMNSYYMDHDYTLPTTEIVIGEGANDKALYARAEGCYQETGSKAYVYYSVLSER